jgi:hypothetical protein
MARYFARSCPRCGGYVGITMHDPRNHAPLKAVNGPLRAVQLPTRVDRN